MDELNTTVNPGAGTPPRARWPVVLAVGVLAASGFGAWYLLTHEGTPAQPMLEPAPTAAPAEPAAPAAPPMTTAESDALLRERLARLSSSPELAAWLKESDLLRRFIGVVVAFADGESPRALVGFLAPHGPFQAQEKRGRLAIDPASYARYDAIGRVVGGLDANGLADVFQAVRPMAEFLYREGAPPGSTLDAALARAFDRVLAVPLLEGEVALEQRGATYTFADPALEGLTPAEKHLLRMGPATVKTLQGKVRQVASALDIGVSHR